MEVEFCRLSPLITRSFTQGDLLIVLAAFVHTLHVVRLGKYAKETTHLKLAASKATAEAILSVGLVILLMTIGASPLLLVQVKLLQVFSRML